MKKYAILIFIVIIIVVGISYMYLTYKANYNQTKLENSQYQSYYEKDIYGSDLATIINKSIDNNKINNVEKDENGKYINNHKDSIQVDIYFLDDEKTHSMEEFFDNGIDKFITYYSQIKFNCKKIDYHPETSKVSYMLFVQVTE